MAPDPRRDASDRPDERTSGGPSVAKWQLGALVGFFVVYAVTVLATGQPEFLIPVVILAVLVMGYALVTRRLAKRVISRDGSMDAAMSDNEDPVPGAHLVPDDDTALGDTPEAHDEISPHDLPKDHPGRQAAEQQAGSSGGTTRGHVDPSEAASDGERR